jgi:prefoldin subunit 5
MVERALELLQNRVDEIREMLQCIDGPAARKMEQEMDRIQKIIDAFRTNAADPD